MPLSIAPDSRFAILFIELFSLFFEKSLFLGITGGFKHHFFFVFMLEMPFLGNISKI